MFRLLFSLATAIRADDRPNIVFILLDDLGWSCRGPFFKYREICMLALKLKGPSRRYSQIFLEIRIFALKKDP